MLKSIINSVVNCLPAESSALVRSGLRRIRYGGFARRCPLCNCSLKRFLPDGVPVREEAICPICQSKEVHRISWLFLARRIRISERPLRFLHIAPESILRQQLSCLQNISYVSGDLQPGVGELAFDIYQMPLADNSFDVVFLSHVLNALPDDEPALKEILRVLVPGGIVIPPVPLEPGGMTKEALTREARLELCSDPDIYRIYGEDLLDRMLRVGFQADRVDFFSEFSAAEQRRYGLQGTPLIIGTKPTPRSDA